MARSTGFRKNGLVSELILDPPLLHRDSAGNPALWRVSAAVADYLDRVVYDGARTLETGAGLSTILFTVKRCHHTAVTADANEADRILAWCQANGVPTDRLKFVARPSEDALPELELEPLDLVLIDGAHGFPFPFLDWFYAGRHLRVGGLAVVDDTQIWTGRVLRHFLASDPNWRIETERYFDFAAATRLTDDPVGEWFQQPFVSRRSFDPDSESSPHRVISYMIGAVGMGRVVLTAAQRRELGMLIRVIRKRRPSIAKPGPHR